MRRLLFTLLTAVMLLGITTPAAAATDTFRYAIRGAGAWASGAVYDGDRFEAFWVEIGDEATRASDGESYLSYVLFEHLLEVCGTSGCVTKYTFGWVENVPFGIDRRKLSRASIEATIDAIRCTDDGNGETCRAVRVPIRIAWAGEGRFIRSHGTSSGGVAGEYQYTLNGAATERWASVSGSIGRFDIATAAPIGALYRTRLAERSVTHV